MVRKDACTYALESRFSRFFFGINVYIYVYVCNLLSTRVSTVTESSLAGKNWGSVWKFSRNENIINHVRTRFEEIFGKWGFETSFRGSFPPYVRARDETISASRLSSPFSSPAITLRYRYLGTHLVQNSRNCESTLEDNSKNSSQLLLSGYISTSPSLFSKLGPRRWNFQRGAISPFALWTPFRNIILSPLAHQLGEN